MRESVRRQRKKCLGNDTYEATTPEDLEQLIKEINTEVGIAIEHVKTHMAQRE